jgi:diguanylate cyclase (GGDEF)-like protein
MCERTLQNRTAALPAIRLNQAEENVRAAEPGYYQLFYRSPPKLERGLCRIFGAGTHAVLGGVMRRPSVLVVDDDAFSRAVVSRRVAKFSDVVEAEDGIEALARLQKAVFDLAIVDLEMPNFNGLDLIKCVRGHPTLKHIPIIVLTGNETRTALEGALTAGATSFLLKPLNWSTFGDHISHVLDLAYRAGHLALHDMLTGLPNRVLLNERLEQALARTKDGEAVATHILDLDHFKDVNDTLGHPVGDKLLRKVAERLRALVRETDTIARMGGDEFAIVQAPLAAAGDAVALGVRVIEAVSEPYDIDGQQVVVGASVGIALSPLDTASPERLMRNADLALYQAKGAGRGTYRVFEPEMDAQMQARRAMENDLRRALAEGQFELHYQPVVNLATNEINGFEALIRWCHPDKGVIPPGSFIPLAEEIGLIVSIGEWVVREACATAARWPHNITIAVNISAAQMRNPGLVQMVMSALSASGLSPSRLELEITETALLTDNELTLSMLHQLQELGVRVANDDFGTGYSSLSHLQSFPFDRIKIDRSFVKDIADCSGSLNIVRAMATLASGLGIKATAEGVENKAQLDSVRSEGCTEMQGFLMSGALPAAEIERLFLSERAEPASDDSAAAA